MRKHKRSPLGGRARLTGAADHAVADVLAEANTGGIIAEFSATSEAPDIAATKLDTAAIWEKHNRAPEASAKRIPR